MKILIVYATTEGHTKKIAEFLNDIAVKAGHETLLCNATDDQPNPEGFQLAIICASVHIGKYQSAVQHYATDYHKQLNSIPSAFFSVSLTAAADDAESWKDLVKITTDFYAHTGWQPKYTQQVAGALLYTQYDFFKRFIMRLISKHYGGATDTSQDFEYTDWNKLKDFFLQILNEVK